MPEEKEELEDSKNSEEEGEETKEDFSDREKQLYARAHRAEGRLKTIEGEVDTLKTKEKESGLSVDEKKELEAKTYLKKITKEVLDENKKVEAKATEQEQQKFDEEVGEILEANPDVKKAEFLKFIEDEAEKYGIEKVKGAMNLYKKINEVSKDASEKTKKDLQSKPSLPSHEGGGGTPPDDSEKTLFQIANEAKKELT